MGRRKPFIDKKRATTYRLVYKPDTGGEEPQQILVPVSEEPQPQAEDQFLTKGLQAEIKPFGCYSQTELSEEKRREIVELGLPDDGYDYLKHLRVLKSNKLSSVWPSETQATTSSIKINVDQPQRTDERQFAPPAADVKFLDARGVDVELVDEEPDDLDVSATIQNETFKLEEVRGQQAREIRELEALMRQMEDEDVSDDNYKNNASPSNYEYQNSTLDSKGDLLDDFVISATAQNQEDEKNQQLNELIVALNGSEYDTQKAKNMDNSDVVSTRSGFTTVTSISIGSEAVSGSQYTQEVQLEKFQMLMEEYDRDGDFEGLEDILEGNEVDSFSNDGELNDIQFGEGIQQLQDAMNELILSKKGAMSEAIEDGLDGGQDTIIQLANKDEEMKRRTLELSGVNVGCEGDSKDDDEGQRDDDKMGLKSTWVEMNLERGMQWDCESIASARSSTKYQASVLSAPRKITPQSKSQFKQKSAQIPPNILAMLKNGEQQEAESVSQVSTQSLCRSANETPEEKRLRKAAVKSLRRENRAKKKELKQMFSQERVSQQRHLASMGVQAKIVL
eukprot:TRINITY_DN3723_c0_g1_i3.p2 TRINITY_DN3723_c0_g1~~TRINITY_DN3723_c0_g1_i3.p2  ORF type:complete len:563 (-),score=104.11 TRINITY_DN3723_c0_g1_i3:388-2076(-)